MFVTFAIVCLVSSRLLDAKIASFDGTGRSGREEGKIQNSADNFREGVLSVADDPSPPESDRFGVGQSDPDAGTVTVAVPDRSAGRRQKLISDKLKSALSRTNEKLLHSKLREAGDARMEQLFFSWVDFKKQHGKKYETFKEEKYRFQIYADNHEQIRLHNLAYDVGLKSYTLAVNKFADMTNQEFKKTMNGFKQALGNGPARTTGKKFLVPMNFAAPEEVDWRTQGYVTPVKDQGHCGSCWAFSATGSLEGQHKRQTGTLVSLSEQNLIDCSFKFGNEGCNGGLMDNAFQYIKANHGVDTEKSYPYEAKEGKCRFKKTAVGADDAGFVDVDHGNETALVIALASQGPVSVAIDAGHNSFQFYSTGIYYEPKCSSTELDHGVLAVGYGTLGEDKDYWIIKNSWGKTWGDEGYVKIARNRDNHCGVATQASYPSV